MKRQGVNPVLMEKRSLKGIKQRPETNISYWLVPSRWQQSPVTSV